MFIFWVLYTLIAIPLLLVYPTIVIGRKNFNKKKNYIVIANHQSNMDPIMMDFYLNKRLRYIAKQELWRGKEKSFLFETVLGCIPVDRSKGLTLTATKQVYALLKNNESLGLFPEGTRHHEEGEDMAVKNGACMFAIKTKTPLLPCYILKKPKPFSFNKIIVGEPFELNDFYDKKLDKDTLNEASKVLIEKITSLKINYEKKIEEKKSKKQAK